MNLEEGYMKTNELRKPLIQSAIVLAVIIFLISMVGGSESTSFLGMISSIVVGLIRAVWFVIVLPIAILVAIACLIGVYFGVVALYSMESAKKLWGQLLESISRVRATYTCSDYTPGKYATPETAIEPMAFEDKETASQPKSEVAAAVQKTETQVPAAAADPKEIESLNEKLDTGLTEIHSILMDIKTKENEIEKSISNLTLKLEEKAGAELSEEVIKMAGAQEEVNTVIAKKGKRLDSIEASLSQHSSTTADLVNKISELQKSLSDANSEINQLQEMVTSPLDSEPEDTLEHRIFTYIENKKDRQLFAAKIEEAVEKDMTYAEIDAFLSESLSKEIDAIIKDHPSLTKDYIRINKKQS